MQMLHDRYAECQQALPAERAAFEATFSHTEEDGTIWMYHLSLVGEGSPGLDTSNPVGAAHEAWERQVKERGWAEHTPSFLLDPTHLIDELATCVRSGVTGT